MSQLQKLVNLGLSEIPRYISGYKYALLTWKKEGTNILEHYAITSDELQYLRKMLEKAPTIPANIAEREVLETLLKKGLVSSQSDDYYLSEMASKGRYNLIPRRLKQE